MLPTHLRARGNGVVHPAGAEDGQAAHHGIPAAGEADKSHYESGPVYQRNKLPACSCQMPASAMRTHRNLGVRSLRSDSTAVMAEAALPPSDARRPCRAQHSTALCLSTSSPARQAFKTGCARAPAQGHRLRPGSNIAAGRQSRSAMPTCWGCACGLGTDSTTAPPCCSTSCSSERLSSGRPANPVTRKRAPSNTRAPRPGASRASSRVDGSTWAHVGAACRCAPRVQERTSMNV